MEATQLTRSMRLRVGARFTFTSLAATPAVFLVRPHAADALVLEESWRTTPHGASHDYVDHFGNVCRRTTLPNERWDLVYDALVETSDELDPVVPDATEAPVAELPDDVLVYTLASRFCLSDVLGDEAWRRFGGVRPGWERVQAICDFVHEHIRFAYGSSSPTTTSVDAFQNAMGVCRDYAHLAITFCRALNIPARYAFGYLPDIDVPPPYLPMDFCAWFEAFLGGRWYIFDARNNVRRKGRVTIARGRDALDVAMVTAYGGSRLDAMTVVADLAETDARPAR